MQVTVTLANGMAYSATVQAGPMPKVNRFSGAGRVNAEAAVKSVTQKSR